MTAGTGRSGPGHVRQGCRVSETFWRRGYLLVEDLVKPEQLTLMARAMDLSHQGGQLVDQSASSATEALGAYNPVLGDMLLRHCRARLGSLIGYDLVESYSYWRLYREGSELRPHKDRDACEISATITIETAPGAKPWPITLIDLEGETTDIVIPPGAGLLFRGSLLQHWREPLTGPWHKQIFLHYVRKDGPYSDYAFDRRREESAAPTT